MQRHAVTFKELSRRLEPHGVKLEGAQLSNKVNRGTFSMAFFLQCMRVLDVGAIRFIDEEPSAPKLDSTLPGQGGEP